MESKRRRVISARSRTTDDPIKPLKRTKGVKDERRVGVERKSSHQTDVQTEQVSLSDDAVRAHREECYDYNNGSFTNSFFDSNKRGRERVLRLNSKEELQSESLLSSSSSSSLLVLLPNELLLHIMAYLNPRSLVSCGLVCRRLNRLAFSPNFWSRIHVGTHSVCFENLISALRERDVKALKACKVLFKSSHGDHQEDVCKNISKGLVKLNYLDLTLSTLKPLWIEHMLNGCRSLIKASFEGCTINYAISRHLALNGHLQVLHLAMVKGLTDECVEIVVDGCSKLEELNLAWTNLSFEALSHLTSNLSRRMKRLNLSGHRTTLDDTHILKLVQRCSSIEQLDLDDCNQVSSKSVEILSLLEHLKVLNMSRCFNILPSKFLMLNNLRELNVFGSVKEETKRVLIQKKPLLKVNVSVVSNIGRPTPEPFRSSMWGIKMKHS